MIHRIFSAAAAGLLLPGCVSTPGFDFTRANVEIPDGWAEYAAARPVADSDWVATFKDAGLNSVVAEALEQNRDLAQIAARVKAAEANAIIAGANAKPQLEGDLNSARSQRNFIGFPGAGRRGGSVDEGAVVQPIISNNFDLGLNIRWELDIWGRVRAGQQAALAELQASKADYEATRLSIAGQTAKAWFGLVAALEQTALAERAWEVFQDTEKTIRGDFEEGIEQQGRDIASELQLAMSDVQQARAALAQRSGDSLRFRRRIEVLLGRYPAGKLKSGAKLVSLPGLPPAGIPAQVLERRPDLLASERRLAATDRRVLEARRSLLPAISLTAGYGTSTPELSEILNGDFAVWNLANNIAQPLLDGNRLRQTVKVRQAESEAAQAEYEQTVLNAFQEVEDALASDRFLAEQERSLAASAGLSQNALDRARESYADGVGDVLTILASQQRLINTESTLIDVRRQRLENRIDLHLALGGDFGTPEERLSVD